MTKDNFSLLSQPRRPWLDADVLKQKFLALSTTTHPDKIHASSAEEKAAAARAFAELNAAYNCLAEPKSRLLHLLELETGTRPPDIQQIPADLADLFAGVATVCRAADGFLATKAGITSPLLQVQWFEQAQDWTAKLNGFQQKLNALHSQLIDRLKSLDQSWMSSDPEHRTTLLLPQIEELYRLFGYLNRWNRQIQERVARLYEV